MSACSAGRGPLLRRHDQPFDRARSRHRRDRRANQRQRPGHPGQRPAFQRRRRHFAAQVVQGLFAEGAQPVGQFVERLLVNASLRATGSHRHRQVRRAQLSHPFGLRAGRGRFFGRLKPGFRLWSRDDRLGWRGEWAGAVFPCRGGKRLFYARHPLRPGLAEQRLKIGQIGGARFFRLSGQAQVVVPGHAGPQVLVQHRWPGFLAGHLRASFRRQFHLTRGLDRLLV